MRVVVAILVFGLCISCATTKQFSSSPQDSSRPTDPQYTQDQITVKIPTEDLDKNLSRVYASTNTAHLSAIPLTGALIDSIGFLKSAKDDYNKFEYRKVADGYKAYLFNKVSCFYVFAKGPNDLSNLSQYHVSIANVGSEEHKAVIKSEQEHEFMLKTLNEIFPKTYSEGQPRSIATDSVYTQELICGNKIDFKKPFTIKFKSLHNDKTITELFWL